MNNINRLHSRFITGRPLKISYGHNNDSFMVDGSIDEKGPFENPEVHMALQTIPRPNGNTNQPIEIRLEQQM